MPGVSIPAVSSPTATATTSIRRSTRTRRTSRTPAYLDQDCDGIDGDAATMVFLDPAGGSDLADGLSSAGAVRTLGTAYTAAVASGRSSNRDQRRDPDVHQHRPNLRRGGPPRGWLRGGRGLVPVAARRAGDHRRGGRQGARRVDHADRVAAGPDPRVVRAVAGRVVGRADPRRDDRPRPPRLCGRERQRDGRRPGRRRDRRDRRDRRGSRRRRLYVRLRAVSELQPAAGLGRGWRLRDALRRRRRTPRARRRQRPRRSGRWRPGGRSGRGRRARQRLSGGRGLRGRRRGRRGPRDRRSGLRELRIRRSGTRRRPASTGRRGPRPPAVVVVGVAPAAAGRC